jgi:hypothetical protein
MNLSQRGVVVLFTLQDRLEEASSVIWLLPVLMIQLGPRLYGHNGCIDWPPICLCHGAECSILGLAALLWDYKVLLLLCGLLKLSARAT